MDSLTDNLYLAVSEKIGLRVTPENLRTQMSVLSSTGGITNSIKTDIIIELLLAFAQLESKIDENTRTETTTPTVQS